MKMTYKQAKAYMAKFAAGLKGKDFSPTSWVAVFGPRSFNLASDAFVVCLPGWILLLQEHDDPVLYPDDEYSVVVFKQLDQFEHTLEGFELRRRARQHTGSR